MPMIFREVADAIEARIRAGEWPAGGQIPSTMAIARYYGVSESTAYRALVLLVDRKLIYGHQGKARYVSDRPQGY